MTVALKGVDMSENRQIEVKVQAGLNICGSRNVILCGERKGQGVAEKAKEVNVEVMKERDSMGRKRRAGSVCLARNTGRNLYCAKCEEGACRNAFGQAGSRGHDQSWMIGGDDYARKKSPAGQHESRELNVNHKLNKEDTAGDCH